ncbi:MAG: sulfur carrier protein ThiS adenylyltransferase ThiF [Acidaminococcus sp.]|nr:sulfur carrier protein ThiS adenylyltransferase ThiF [Acidaminococcus sp.]MCI2100105.1 sulfur carrier protein ThiS adenylyltransferase ThiF [Acidaminococcus sp.]MCI2114382.1 sulfur carrier protein ThiS adenylyltransferase ThiF [Acidaminococcus sp.]MCI2116313.1 sulfur carrier protein ThiS adenylyltransferase ThiF [Acidaminococcus sp.]
MSEEADKRITTWPPQKNSDSLAISLYEALCARHGKVVQDKLTRGAVTICGLGGLGSNIAVNLCRIGVGHLRLVDFDTVDWTNLNRQSYFIEHVGMLKTEALLSFLKKINPYLSYETVTARITPENVLECVGTSPIICEAFDRADQKAMLVTEVRRRLPEAILVSGSGMAGCGHSNLMKVRKVSEHFYLCGDEKTAPRKNAGLMAPRVAICAGMMANTVTQLLLDEK